MNKGSYLYKELTQTEILAVSDKVLPGERVLSFELLKGGLFNTTYKNIADRSKAVSPRWSC